jgi:hypothetical protein
MNRSAFVLLGLLLAASAQAQTVYKYQMPDGRVTYSDKRVPGAKLVEELEPPPAPTGAAAEEARRRAAREAAAVRAAAAKQEVGNKRSLDQAWIDLRHWNQKLEEARVALEAGREPREGERIGTAAGRARMNDAYWNRQRTNAAAVAEAEARAREAQETINQLR